MPCSETNLIHPTAVISEAAQLGENVRVAPFAVIEGPVIVGAGTTIGPGAHLIGPLTLGARNLLGAGVALGGAPQHLGYKGEQTDLVIGDGNQFREHVTVHRGMPAGVGPGTGVTRIGHRNLFMVGSHVAHDCVVGNECLFANGAAIAGHVQISDRVLISGNSVVHQFCRIGRLGLLSGVSAITKDLPPFWIIQEINRVCAVNTIGMRRAGMSTAEIQAVRRAFALIYRERLPIPMAVQRMEAELGHVPAIRELVEFIRSSKRGIPGAHQFQGRDEAAGEAA